MRRSWRSRLRGAVDLRVLIPAGIGAVCLAVIAVVLAFASVPRLGAMLAPHAPRATFDAAAAYSVSGDAIPPLLRERLEKAARRAPLAADPFFFSALRLPRNESAESIRLLEEARRRNPRYRLARLMLLERYVRAQSVQAATDEMVVLTRLLPDSSEILVSQLGFLAADPATSEATRRALGDGPIVDDVLLRLARSGAPVELIIDFARDRRGGNPESAALWQALVMDSLVRRGEIDRAYGLWRQFSGLPANQPRALVYDPGFSGLPGTPPFNWAYASSQVGAAEPRSDGRLEVAYFGRQSGELLSQLLTLRPGRYRLRFRAEGAANGVGSRLVWRMTCAGANAPFFEMPIRNVNYTPRNMGGEFTVPANCPAQWLRLDGQSAEFPTNQSLQISNFAVQVVGGAS